MSARFLALACALISGCYRSADVELDGLTSLDSFPPRHVRAHYDDGVRVQYDDVRALEVEREAGDGTLEYGANVHARVEGDSLVFVEDGRVERVPRAEIERVTVYGDAQRRSGPIIGGLIFGTVAGALVGALAPGECVRGQSEDPDSMGCYITPFSALGGALLGAGVSLAFTIPLTADWQGEVTRPQR